MSLHFLFFFFTNLIVVGYFFSDVLHDFDTRQPNNQIGANELFSVVKPYLSALH